MFIRTSYIDTFRELLLTGEKQYIFLVGGYESGKSYILNALREDGSLNHEATLWLNPHDGELAEQMRSLDATIKTLVFDSEHGINIDYFRSFIESYQIDCRCIFTAEGRIDDELGENFLLPFVSFREYTDTLGYALRMSDIMSGIANISELNTLNDSYIHLWDHPRHISNPDTIHPDFELICTLMKSELFDKEHIQFMEFFRALAMETGNCFKADKLANLLGITRRKVNKYMEVLVRYAIVKPIGPWVQDMETESSRHVKIYFRDLSIFRSLLGDMYYQGAMKLGALENFILLELDRKLSSTHDISYYRKKSGSEVTFILEERNTKKLTPIEVVARDCQTISQALKSFDSDYHSRVEHYMILNESRAEKRELAWIPVFILPHATI